MSQHNTGRPYTTYVPAVDDILSPPPPPENAQPQRSQDTTGLGFVVVSAHVLVGIILVVGMVINGEEAGRALLIGGIYCALTVVFSVFVVSGALSDMVAVWQREKTERFRIDAYAETAALAIEWRQAVERNRELEMMAQRRPPAHPLPEVPEFTSTYVPPQAEEVVREAKRWARGLYGDDGQPDPRKVQLNGDKRGWLRVRMLGSKRDAGSRAAGAWLIDRHFIRDVPGGYVVNLAHFPDRESVRRLA